MTEKETFACEIAGDNYGLTLEQGPARAEERGRLFKDERDAFDAGWAAAKEYYEKQ